MVDKPGLSEDVQLSLERSELSARVQTLFQESISVKQQLIDSHVDTVVRIGEAISDSLQRGGKLMLCGNGGSAADAQHIATELLVRLRPDFNRQGVPALSLATDTSSLTACGNDYSFDYYYERMVRTLGKPGDVLIGITTSGASQNVIRALRTAREMDMTAVGLLGAGGGPALAECDLALVVPSSTTGRIQESHIMVGHALMELVEDLLLESGWLTRA